MAINNAESNPHKPQDTINHDRPMGDDKVDKVDSLKSLNALLLKETVERRQQVDSLVQLKNQLEFEYNRCVMDKDSLQLEMNVVCDEAVVMEIEKSMAFVVVNCLVEEVIGGLEGELKSVLGEKGEIERLIKEKDEEIGDLKRRLDKVLVEIDEERGVSSRVSDERDEIRALLDDRIREVSELRVKVAEAEENEGRISKEVAELKGEYDRLMVEKTDSERRVESIMKEKDDLQKDLNSSNGVIDELQRNVAEVLEQKKVIEDEKIVQDGKNSELQASVDELKKLVESMRVEEATLVEKLADLEKKYAASSSNEAEMKVEMDGLIEEKKKTEMRMDDLAKEKSLVTEDLEAAMKELEEQKLSFERVVKEKTELDDEKILRESEIVKMNEQLNVCKDMISLLETSCANQTEKVKELEVEVGSYKSSFDQATTEKDEVLKQLNDEKAITADLKQSITGMEKEMEDLSEKLATLTTENKKHLGEKNQLEDRCAGLVKEVAVLEAKFSESRMEFDGKLGAAEANSNRVLNILKKTASVCDGEDNDVDQENGVEEGIKEHVEGIKAIKRAFKDKESRLEEMKRQLELVKSSAAEAQKEKSFWTMVSSATTLLAAAASLAYVARAH